MVFKPCGLFGKELHKVEGYILDKRYHFLYTTSCHITKHLFILVSVFNIVRGVTLRECMFLYVCSKKKLCAIYGKWTECLYTVDPAIFDAHKKSDKKNSDEKKANKRVLDLFLILF